MRCNMSLKKPHQLNLSSTHQLILSSTPTQTLEIIGHIRGRSQKSWNILTYTLLSCVNRRVEILRIERTAAALQCDVLWEVCFALRLILKRLNSAMVCSPPHFNVCEYSTLPTTLPSHPGPLQFANIPSLFTPGIRFYCKLTHQYYII